MINLSNNQSSVSDADQSFLTGDSGYMGILSKLSLSDMNTGTTDLCNRANAEGHEPSGGVTAETEQEVTQIWSISGLDMASGWVYRPG